MYAPFQSHFLQSIILEITFLNPFVTLTSVFYGLQSVMLPKEPDVFDSLKLSFITKIICH